MTEFVLRIFFSGLIAFVPNSDNTEVSVVLVNTHHNYTLANGAPLPHHRPLLLARAASCQGTCRPAASQAGIASFLFSQKTATEQQALLNSAVTGGGAWELSGADLTLTGPTGPLTFNGGRTRDTNNVLSKVPTSSAERKDFSWVADLSDLAPEAGGFKMALTLSEPQPACTVAARLKLKNGNLSTYSLVRINAKARPVYFRQPAGSGPEGPYSQAVANWVLAEIPVTGDSIEIMDQNFDNSSQIRTMKLYPHNGKVDIALLNLPPYETPHPEASAPDPEAGQHFQAFYDLVRKPPAYAERLVPHQALSPSPAEPQTDWAMLHPRLDMWSDLLEDLGLSPKGPYDLAICPIIKD